MDIDEETKKRWDTKMYTVCSFCYKEYTFNEYLKCKSPWIDSKNKQYGKKVLCQCGVDLFFNRWKIVSKKDNYFVMTVHLTIACGGIEFENWFDYNHWYETKFWYREENKPREFADFEKRYHTRDEAIQGHRFVVDNLTKIVEHPERFPQGILNVMYNSIKAKHEQRKTIESHVKENLK